MIWLRTAGDGCSRGLLINLINCWCGGSQHKTETTLKGRLLQPTQLIRGIAIEIPQQDQDVAPRDPWLLLGAIHLPVDQKLKTASLAWLIGRGRRSSMVGLLLRLVRWMEEGGPYLMPNGLSVSNVGLNQGHCHLLHLELYWGWYPEERLTVAPNALQKTFQFCNVNCSPQS